MSGSWISSSVRTVQFKYLKIKGISKLVWGGRCRLTNTVDKIGERRESIQEITCLMEVSVKIIFGKVCLLESLLIWPKDTK